jgi:hypothetical protein
MSFLQAEEWPEQDSVKDGVAFLLTTSTRRRPLVMPQIGALNI